jgi:hypothetical protein
LQKQVQIRQLILRQCLSHQWWGNEGKSVKCWRRHSLYTYWCPQQWQLPLQTMNAEVAVLSSQTSCEIICRVSVTIFAANQGQFDFLYPVPSIPGSLSHHSFLCCWFKRRNSEWSDVPFSCLSLVYKVQVLKVLLVTYFVTLLQPTDLMCKTVCSVQIHNFLPVCFPSLPEQQLDTLQVHSVYSEIWKRYSRLVYESSVTKNHAVTASLSWPCNSCSESGMPFHNFLTH